MNKAIEFKFIFRALRHRNYRLFFTGQGISLVGTWMQQIAMSWLVYRLTNSALLLGVVGFLAYLPAFLLMPLAGVISDRCNRRRILIATQALAMLQALVLSVLVLTGNVAVWHIMWLSILLGIVNSFDMPIRQAFTVEMIENREDLGNAIALNSSIVNMARLIGPSIAGILIALWGEGVCFLLNAVSYVTVIISLFAMKIAPKIITRPNRHILHDLKEGFIYAFNFTPIKSILILLSLVSLMGVPYQVLMPIFARDIFHGGSKTLGFLMAMSGTGALMGAIYLAGRKDTAGLNKVIVAAAGLFGLGIITFALSRILWFSMAIICIAGFAMMVQMAASNTVLQTIVEEDKRGRVMSLYTMAFMGMVPFGSLLAGSLASRVGAPDTLLFGGICCIIGAFIFVRSMPALREKIRPIHIKKGIIPEVAEGIGAASGLEILGEDEYRKQKQYKRIRQTLSVFLISLLIGAGISFAKDEERQQEIEKALFIASAAQDKVLKIGMVDCIAYVLKNNSEINIERIEPKLKEADVKIAKAGFEPSATLDYTLHSDTEKSASVLYPEVSKTRKTDLNAGISGKLITGTEYNVDFLNEKYKSSLSTQSPNPYYTAEPKITITQPLFKGAGMLINRADIIIAQNNKEVSAQDFKYTVMDIISKAKMAYYNYIYYLKYYALLKTSLERSRDLLEINKARYEKGLLSSVDLLETETAVAEREKSLLSAESGLKKAEDDLKLITNLVDDPQVWNAKIELIDGEPEFKEEKRDLFECMKEAFLNRPDYNSQRIDLKNKDVKIAAAKNSLFPTVDLAGSFGLNGLGRDYQDALESADSDYKDWAVGLEVNVPWGGAERAKLNQRNLEKARSLLALKRLEQNIILEVRDKLRAVDIQIRQVKASEVSREKEENNYQAQKERYAAGEISTHDILDYQEKLSRAELDYVKALIDYNTALINLDKSEGLTLVKNNVKLEEE